MTKIPNGHREDPFVSPEFNCTSCGTTLEIVERFEVTETAECAKCGAVLAIPGKCLDMVKANVEFKAHMERDRNEGLKPKVKRNNIKAPAPRPGSAKAYWSGEDSDKVRDI